MKILSRAYDKRINSANLYIEILFEEYLSFARDIIENNDLQRKKIKSSKTVYSLLKDDLKQGCIMPPLVLAIVGDLPIDTSKVTEDELFHFMRSNPKNVLILDGLQRTYTLIDAFTEISNDESQKKDFSQFTLRLEIYIGINKFGILYRMLTLNTGQTPMTARHQLEILYKDLLNKKINDITLLTDVMDRPDPMRNEFAFKNVIDGFNSFLKRSELPIDREDLLENIRMLDNMASERIDQDLFLDFIGCYAKVFNKLRCVTRDIVFEEDYLREELGISNTPFGSSVSKVFSTSQALTGFGSAIGIMKGYGLIDGFSEVEQKISEISCNEYDWFGKMLVYLNDIKNKAKKIGNAQRIYFQYFFRDLLNPEGDSFLKLTEAVESAYHKYRVQL